MIMTNREIGHWVWDPDNVDWGIGAWVCSKCGCKNDNIPWKKDAVPHMYAGARFCPQCGIPMSAKEKKNK